MKLKLIFCIFLLYVTLILNAQPWQGNNPVWTNSSVGIGTQSPLHDLGIGAAIFGLQKTDASPNAGYIRFGDNTGWKLHIGRGKESYGSPVNTDITGVLMTIQDYGNIGIGTSSPINRLDVNSATSEPSLNYASIAVANFRGLSNTQLAISSSSAIPFGVSLQVKHSILDGYSYPLILQPVGGNVGIGTTAPTKLFTIQKNVASAMGAGIYLWNNTYNDNVGAGTELIFGHYNDLGSHNRYSRIYSIGTSADGVPGRLSFGMSNDTFYDYMSILLGGNVGIGTTTPIYKFEVKSPGTDGVTVASRSSTDKLIGFFYEGSLGQGELYLREATGSDNYVRISATGNSYFLGGNVGIGTANSGEYKLNVDGKIRADEVVVNTGGADFVFEPDYKLPELAEIEKYIKEYRRLPDIPLAGEMKENGMNMSEIQTKLLQKLEEMTLYLIEQNKQIQALKRKIEKMESSSKNY